MYKHTNKPYININTYTKKSYWSQNKYSKSNIKSYTHEELRVAIDFPLANTFIQFGPLIFQQIKGIPMGSNCSPLLADLYLSWLEFQYMKKLMKKDFHLASKLSFNARYIDDIACVNIQNFKQIAKEIYPDVISLEDNDSDNSRDVFLDLDIQVLNDKFCMKVYHKIDDFKFDVVNYPFPDSNIAESIGYKTFLSQILRFGRICSKFEDFASRTKFIYKKLESRGYKDVLLVKYFYKFCCKYPEIVRKFGFNNFKDFKTACFAI